MSVTRDEHTVRIDQHDVTVIGTSGPVESTWRLKVDDAVVAERRASGHFELRGAMPDGSEVQAQVHQAAFGPTEVVVLHDDEQVVRFTGFVI